MSDFIKLVNNWSITQFVHTFGGLFEESPWVAELSWPTRPFDSFEQMMKVMTSMVLVSNEDVQLQLLRKHPDLGARIRMSNHSVKEQSGAGLDHLTEAQYNELRELNREYTSRFGFPFILAVKGHTADSILEAIRQRNRRSPEEEFHSALKEVFKIASIRLEQWIDQMGDEHELVVRTAKTQQRTMYCGKGDIWVYRSYAKPLTGIQVIPESPFAGRSNVLFGVNVKVAIQGDHLLPSFAEANHSDTLTSEAMNQFVLKHAAEYTGATMEGFLAYVSERFLVTYPQISKIQMTGDQILFEDTLIHTEGRYRASDLVYRYSQNDRATAAIEAQHVGNRVELNNQFSGIADLKLIKVQGGELTDLTSETDTASAELARSPLALYLNVNWRYEDPRDGIHDERGRYVPAEQVRDVAAAAFHDCTSASIQHLLYQIGRRLLSRFDQLSEVSFESNSRTWVEAVSENQESESSHKYAVYTEPNPSYGFQGFSMTRDDLEIRPITSKKEGA
ncbi:2-oxo-4-hydroxy-4-carboxy-5-ureidoimidazoline decarboxylase [Paenibacillus sp. DCT19]|uniref:2-oxo-4-hydroxy-4-carboxy-5-ureidoimidazoline decarboxylase n=1 Tax=Paenibacillus sp. DCT19 TaxID=2211212 RepID=UPI000FE1F047|nr:2-oxo-4-hydroxy-4-carboxy-5-ureidoimidazoline decarboxylase [Paenibacillus sp. DCT19]